MDGVTATYVYDGDGHRVEDTAANRLFWYGASGELLETTDAGSTNHDYIYFAGRRIARYDSGGTVYYLYDDANGSLRTMTDASGNQLCWADYYPFGEPVSGTGCSGDNYQFAGLYADAAGEDGGHSAAQRRYNDTYYRWFSPDPAGEKAVMLDNPQTWNMYAYVADNPTALNDPSGLLPPGPPGAGDEDGCSAQNAPGDCHPKHTAQEQSRLIQGLKGDGEIALGVGLIATVAGGDAPGGVAGTILVANALLTGTALTVKGTVDVAGTATKTDVAKGDQALEATGNLGGLAVTAASGGNLKAGGAAATLTSFGVAAANPMESTRNIATGVEAGRTVINTLDLARSAVSTVRAGIGPLSWPLFF